MDLWWQLPVVAASCLAGVIIGLIAIIVSGLAGAIIGYQIGLQEQRLALRETQCFHDECFNESQK